MTSTTAETTQTAETAEPGESAERLTRIARERYGVAELREGQLEAMTAVAAGRDALVVMPTGYGKSLVYQTVAVDLPGPTVVVSPLIALQHDQVASLADAPDAAPGVAVNSTLTAGEAREAWRSVREGETEFLFLSPEQLAKESVVERLRAVEPSLVVVDEAHCVSDWGHDFRPDYLRLGDVAPRLGRPPVLALTATAAPPVRDEIAARLGLREPAVVVHGFDRPEITLRVVRHTTAEDKRRAVLDDATARGGTGLVYTARRKDADACAGDLAARGRRAAAYHAGLSAGERERVHRAFLAGDVDVVVATSAFGMGIDKADVRFVLHAEPPGSLDAYYQEIGRAGRDGAAAEAVLHYRPEDLGLRRFFSSARLPEDDVAALLRAVRAGGERDVAALGRELGLTPRQVTRALNVLLDVGAARRSGGRVRASGRRTVDHVVADARAAVEARQRVERTRVEMMRGYAETTSCRRAFLLGYLGERHPGACGACDVCLSGEAGPRARPADSAEYGTHAQVVHDQWGTGTVMSTEDDRITVFFPEHGYRTLDLAVVAERGLLEPRPAGP
jgi:ATP-dependent DNA helicase RecQ